MRWFLPNDRGFLDLFIRASANIVDGVVLFRDIVADPRDLAAKVNKLKDFEHAGDRLTHNTLDKLNRSFITPFDREDIHALITHLDDILDAVDAAGQRLVLYRITEMPEMLLPLGEILVASAKEVQKAVLALHDPRYHADAHARCVEINRLENEADALHRAALAKLFAECTDAVTIIKYKELYQLIEEATDRCEDVANVIESIIIKSS
ncbi:MAG: DUF47 domain-containing protein [Acidobacteriota bacterium]|jgi:hypothetical protein